MGAKKIWQIGRDDDCDIIINNKNISRKQAEIVEENGHLFIVNRSKHATSFVQRGQEKIKVQRHKLVEGDLIYFADQGPFDVHSLIDSDSTVIDFQANNRNSNTPAPSTSQFEQNIEKKRCQSCASIIAKTLLKCPECGSIA